MVRLLVYCLAAHLDSIKTKVHETRTNVLTRPRPFHRFVLVIGVAYGSDVCFESEVILFDFSTPLHRQAILMGIPRHSPFNSMVSNARCSLSLSLLGHGQCRLRGGFPVRFSVTTSSKEARIDEIACIDDDGCDRMNGAFYPLDKQGLHKTTDLS